MEFDKILELVERECLGELGRQAVRDQPFSTDFHTIDRMLKEGREFKLTIERNEKFPFAAYQDIRPDLKMLAIDGYVLSVDGFQKIVAILLIIRDLWRFFGGQKKEVLPRLYEILRPLSYDERLQKEIASVFDDNGNVRPDASPELMRIRREQSYKFAELERKFKSILQDFRAKGLLGDVPESFRNGRRVLVVPAEHKRQVRGIIHDESDSGKTCFIEPEGIIDVNNDIFDLEQAERREIWRILRDLSATVRPYIPVLENYLVAIVRYDVIQSKARLAQNLRAGMPILHNRPIFSVRKAFHPLLFLKNKGSGKKTVPFDLRLTDENRILVLSGPNAGGKSVAMKSVGLLQLMLQHGMLVPMNELSEMGVFSKIMADIGDQQSLDDDLSTYSSRLKNAREFVQHADFQSLVLIDEMGSGTDPKPGGALGEAVLKELHKKEAMGVVTTHYSALKVFAFRTKGILNGHMNFDQAHLAPTYELKIGRPGSSFAFEIAAKSGIPKHIIEFARSRMGDKETAVDDILVELQREKQELEERLLAIYDKEHRLDRLIKQYDLLHGDLEVGKKRLKVEQKEAELRQTATVGKEMEKLIKELRGEKNETKARELAAEIKKEREKLTEKVNELHEDLVKTEQKTPNFGIERPAKAGDFVRLRAGGATGRIEEIKGQKATLQLGEMRVTMPVRDLVLMPEPVKIEQKKSVGDFVGRAALFVPDIDIRGLTKEEALSTLEEFVDKSLLTSSHQLRIVHGKGTGALKLAVKNKLREYGGALKNIHHPPPEAGGDGVTLVELS